MIDNAVEVSAPAGQIAARLDAGELVRLPPLRLAHLLTEAAQHNPSLRQRITDMLASTARPARKEPPAGNFIVGQSPAILDVFERIRRFAPTMAPVLITGESGTGKELAAQAIHQRSARAGGPFVAVNCASLPTSLIGSELFGHEKGAFTGAAARRIGHLEAAHGGTLFLDEIGDLPIETQGHLLRFLQEGRITRIGATQSVAVDVRIVSATHVPLEDAIRERRFREDLYYRLHVLCLHMPPLRERGEDITLLATFFLARLSEELGRSVSGFTPQALRALNAYDWPGNVRELIAVLRRAIVMSHSPTLGAADLGLAGPTAAPLSSTLRSNGRRGLIEALDATRGNVTAAARHLGVSRVTFYRMMHRHGVPVKRATDGSRSAKDVLAQEVGATLRDDTHATCGAAANPFLECHDRPQRQS